MKKITLLSLLLMMGFSVSAQCPLPDGSFLGSYFLEQETPIHPENGILSFNDQVITLTAGATPESREFSAVYLEALAIGQPATLVTFTLDCGDVVVDNDIDTSLICDQMSTNITLGPSTNIGVYDEDNDTSFTLILLEYVNNGGCPVPTPIETTFTLTKLTCSVPSDIVFSDAELNSVDVNWSDTNDAATTSWDVEYGFAGFEQGSGIETISNITDTNTSIDNLTENSAYEVYVRAICDAANGESPWVGPFAFNTATDCESLLMGDFPITIDFDDPISFANCFTIVDEDANGNSWIQQELELAAGITANFATNGTNAGLKEDYLISPAIAMEANASYEITATFNGADNGVNGLANEAIEIIVANDNTVAAANSGTSIFSESGIIQNGEFADIEVQALSGSGTFTPTTSGDYYIVFKAFGQPGTTPASSGFLLLFDFTIDETLSTNNFDIFDFTHFYQNGQLGIQANQNFSNLIIYNISGKQVLSSQLSSNNENINVSALSTGVYLAKVAIGNKTETFKFVKN